MLTAPHAFQAPVPKQRRSPSSSMPANRRLQPPNICQKNVQWTALCKKRRPPLRKGLQMPAGANLKKQEAKPAGPIAERK